MIGKVDVEEHQKTNEHFAKTTWRVIENSLADYRQQNTKLISEKYLVNAVNSKSDARQSDEQRDQNPYN